MIWFAIPITVLITCWVAVLLIPETTSATKSIRFDADIEDVWDIYTTPEEQKQWREDVGEVRIADDGHSWSETLEATGMVINFQIVEKNRPETFILATGSPGSFKGQYSAKFTRDGNSTIGTFTETATTIGMIPRVMRFLFFDQMKFIEAYADAVKEELRRRSAE